MGSYVILVSIPSTSLHDPSLPTGILSGHCGLDPWPLLLASYNVAACGVVDTYPAAALLDSLWTAASSLSNKKKKT